MMSGLIEGEHQAEGLRLAIIVSRFNSEISDRLLKGALEALRGIGVEESQLTVYRVPGSFEIPQLARKIAEFASYHAIICLGAVLRGETYHFELISEECARGIQQVSADFTIPVTFGVITADTVEQALERSGEGSENKGWDAAIAAVEMAALFRKVEDTTR
jgi:6,7-dimethyl-8-ribityllumazine synthase